jgi:hypothetical protein
MSPISDPKLRFSDVVYAIETTPKALRNWLQREQVTLDSARPDEGGWRTFSFVDVAILAVTRRLVDFGITVENASKLAHTILTHMQGDRWMMMAKGYKNAPPRILALFWANRSVLIAKEGDEWSLEIWNRFEDFPAGFADAALILHPEDVLRRAMERAADITGLSDDD